MISEAPQEILDGKAAVQGSWLKRFFKRRFAYVDYPFLLAYRGYGSAEGLSVQGHVFRGMALGGPTSKRKSLRNFIALIKMFLVKTVAEAEVCLQLGEEEHLAISDEKGFFHFVIKAHNLQPGWQKVSLRLKSQVVEYQQEVSVQAEVLIAKNGPLGIISDIDDTLLVSHIAKSWKKMYLLITRNPESRKPFAGVVDFYQKLARGTSPGENPFFYVSSSEWNLYPFLIAFMRFHDIPKGILLLKEIKDHWLDFFRSGYGSHSHKEAKIEKILALYPEKSFVLIGDNSQHDPRIYARIAELHPGRLAAVYIRNIHGPGVADAERIFRESALKEIPHLLFTDSKEAAQHAQDLGLIAN